MSTSTKSSAKAETKNSSKNPVQVIELVRRQGIYTGTLSISDVNEIDDILSSFKRNDDQTVVAKQGPQVTELEFDAVGGRKGTRSYCLRLPNIQLQDLEKVGFEKQGKLNLYVK